MATLGSVLGLLGENNMMFALLAAWVAVQERLPRFPTPELLVVRPIDYQDQGRARVLTAVRELNLQGSLTANRLAAMECRDPPVFPGDSDFPAVSGTAYSVDSKGGLISLPFYSVSGESTFQSAVRRLQGLYPKAEYIELEPDGGRLTFPATSTEEKFKQGTLRRGTAGGSSTFGFARSKSGTCILSITSQFPGYYRQVAWSPDSVADALPHLKNRDYYLLFKPRSGSSSRRMRLIGAIQGLTNVALQQRDTESDADYRDRRRASDAWLKLVRSVIRDVQRFEVSVSHTGELGSFRLEMSLEARDRSELSKIFSAIRPRRGMRVEDSDDQVASLFVNARIPKDLQQPLSSTLDHIEVLDPNVRAVGKALVESGEIRLGGAIVYPELDGEPVGFGSIRLDGSPEVPSRFSASAKLLRTNFGFEGVIQRLETMLNLGMVSTSVQTPTPRSILVEEETRAPVLIKARIDLASMVGVPSDKPGPRLLNKVIQFMLDHKRTYRIRTRRGKQAAERSVKSLPPMSPILERMDGDNKNDWAAEATVRLAKNRLTCIVTLEPKLHAYWLARPQFP